MLIGIDASRALAGERTGTENYALHLVRALARLESGHRLRLYVQRPPPAGLLPQGPDLEVCCISFPRMWTHLRLALELARRPPDVLFVPAHVLPWRLSVPAVVTVHDLGHRYHPEAHTRWQRMYLDWSTRHAVRRAARMLADSEATRRDLLALYGADPAQVVVAYPGGGDVTPVEDAALLEATRQKYDTGSAYFLYVGTLQPRKNLVTLVRSFETVVAQRRVGDEARLVLAGQRGWLAAPLLAAIRGSPVAERIVMPGYVPTEDLPALLSGALAFVFPSWYEGFGLPVLEAMRCGTPVIASDAASLPEVVGDAGLLVPPADVAGLADAMARVYALPALRRDLARRGLARAARFSWEACARTALAVLEAAAAEGGARGE